MGAQFQQLNSNCQQNKPPGDFRGLKLVISLYLIKFYGLERYFFFYKWNSSFVLFLLLNFNLLFGSFDNNMQNNMPGNINPLSEQVHFGSSDQSNM